MDDKVQEFIREKGIDIKNKGPLIYNKTEIEKDAIKKMILNLHSDKNSNKYEAGLFLSNEFRI